MLETKLERKFKLITDKGTLDAVGLHPDGAAHKYALFVVFFLNFQDSVASTSNLCSRYFQ